MLQQTQVTRVIKKYAEFIRIFPTVEHLAFAPLADVLQAWQGLGYNRRALNLQRCAQAIVATPDRSVPASFSQLLSLPGVGRSTAGAVCAFAFGIAVPFLETNIRSAFLHHFFSERRSVSDREIVPLVELTLDRENPRQWYYALMDYGSWLKLTVPNPSRRSLGARTQPPFAGSHRQLRATLLRVFLAQNGGALDLRTISALLLEWDQAQTALALKQLVEEGFLRSERGTYRLA
jgi:A/G-specific adenine glycosylase